MSYSGSDDTLSESSVSSDCESDTILSTVNQLSDELETIGLSLSKFSRRDEKVKVLSSVLQATWDLIQYHHSKIHELHRPDDIINRLNDDCKILRGKINSLKEALLKKENQLQRASESERRLQMKYDKVLVDMKKEQNEVRRLLRKIADQEARAAREARQHEKLTRVQRQKLKPAKLPTSPPQEPAEKRIHALAEQNILLRKSLISISDRLTELAHGFSSVVSEKSNDEESEEFQCHSNDRKDPIDFVLEDCNATCAKHLDFLDYALQELSHP